MSERTNFVNFQKALKYVPLGEETKRDVAVVKWAYNVAVTRSFEFNGDRRIAPMGDMVRRVVLCVKNICVPVLLLLLLILMMLCLTNAFSSTTENRTLNLITTKRGTTRLTRCTTFRLDLSC